MRSIITFLLLFATSLTIAQSKTFKATPTQMAALKRQAEVCAGSLLKQDYKTLSYYTYPPVMNVMGGEDKMVAQLSAANTQMQAMGIKLKSVSIGQVKDIVQSQGDLYCIVQDIIQLSLNGTVVTSSSYVLAFSHDKGIRWYFTETAPLKNQNIKQLFPTYPAGMVIPESKKPMMGIN